MMSGVSPGAGVFSSWRPRRDQQMLFICFSWLDVLLCRILRCAGGGERRAVGGGVGGGGGAGGALGWRRGA